jgi:hypothetical protein
MRTRAILAVLAVVVAACGGGVPEAAEPGDTIAVHGDWTIEVYDADGTLDERVEFSNALVGGGQESLVLLLAGFGSAGSWNFEIGESSTPASICPTTGFEGRCFVTPLRVNLLDTDENALYDSLVLTGETEIEAGGEIQFVRSVLKTCVASTSPEQCVAGSGTFRPFTEKLLEPGESVTVAAGQTVQVEVVISFTSG